MAGITLPPGMFGTGAASGPSFTPPTFNAAPSNGNALQSLMSFLKTPGGAAAIGAAGGLLQGYGQSQQANKQMAQNANEFAANMLQQEQQMQQNAAQGALAANPLGAAQQYTQKQALLDAIMPNVRNFRATPGDPAVAAAMGKMSGGLSDLIPQGGFDAATLAAFSPRSTAASIAQHDQQVANLNPDATMSDLSALGFSPEIANLYGGQTAAAQQQYGNQRQAAYNAIQRALQNDIAGQKKQGGGFWHDLAKIGTIAAPIVAAPFTGGLSLAAIGAGAGAANAALNGGGVGSILTGAGLGAIPGLGTPKGLAAGAAAPSFTSGLKAPFTNPTNLGRVALGSFG